MPFDDENEFEQNLRRANLLKAELDRQDLGNEQADRSTGRMTRFLPTRNAELDLSKERKRRDAFRSVLDLLLETDPIYSAAYQEALKSLAAAETVLDDALSAATSALVESEDRLQTIKDQASRLENGVRVFRRSDGAVVDETGRIVPEAEAAGIVWKSGSPSYEAYLKAKESRGDQDGRLYRRPWP